MDDKIAVLARGLLPYAALLHLGFTAWAMTSPTQFSKVPHHCIESLIHLALPHIGACLPR
jgi:hypothetical protein